MDNLDAECVKCLLICRALRDSGTVGSICHALSSSFSIKGVAVAVTVTVHAVGLALDGYGPLNGVGDGQVLELVHDLTMAYLLSNVLGAAVRLGHAVNEETG